jgi:hypothetical protein
MPVKYPLSIQNQRKFACACPARPCAFALNAGGFNGNKFFVFQNGRPAEKIAVREPQ